MEPTSVDPLDHARMIVLGCLGREYSKANTVDSKKHSTMMRQESDRFCDRFQNRSAAASPSQPIDGDFSDPRRSTVRWVAVTLLINMSFIAVFSWYVLLR